MRIEVFVRTVVLVGLSALTFPATARAGSIFLGNDFFGSNVHYFFSGTTYKPFTLGSVTMSEGAGLGPSLDAPNSFEAYCIDINTDVFESSIGLPEPPATYSAEAALMSGWSDPSGLITLPGAGSRAAWLYNTYAATFSATQLDERSALQLALWNTLYDVDFSVSPSAGNFYVSVATADTAGNAASYAAIASLANGFLTDLQNNLGQAALSDAAWLQLSVTTPATETEPAKTIDAQDFIGPLTPATPVPEPGAGMLLGMGIASLAAFRSRKSFLRRS